jgi:hypothetical protein
VKSRYAFYGLIAEEHQQQVKPQQQAAVAGTPTNDGGSALVHVIPCWVDFK